MGCVIWLEQVDSDTYITLGSTFNKRAGHKLTVSGKELCKVYFKLKRTNTSANVITVTIRKVSDDSIIETSSTTYQQNEISTSFEWYEFALTSTINEEVRIMVEYSGSARIDVAGYLSDVITGILTRYDGSIYTDWSGYDATIKLYEEEAPAFQGERSSVVPIMKALGLI